MQSHLHNNLSEFVTSAKICLSNDTITAYFTCTTNIKDVYLAIITMIRYLMIHCILLMSLKKPFCCAAGLRDNVKWNMF